MTKAVNDPNSAAKSYYDSLKGGQGDQLIARCYVWKEVQSAVSHESMSLALCVSIMANVANHPPCAMAGKMRWINMRQQEERPVQGSLQAKIMGLS